MKTHMGYKSKGNEVQCSVCEEWMGPADSCAIIYPGMIEEGGKARETAKAIHGVVHKDCLKQLTLEEDNDD